MRALALLCALLAGCAPVAMIEAQCGSTNWYEKGYKDALMGMRPSFGLYACAAQAAVEKDYMSGWSIGYSEWDNRVSGSRI